MQISIPAYQSFEQILRTALGNYSPAEKDQIIQANHLDWPYVVDGGESTSAFASGSVQVTWTALAGGTIPAGTLVKAPTYQSGPLRHYTTQSALTFVSLGQSLTVPIVCTVEGEWGNAPPFSVTQIPDYATQCTITNSGPINGGYAYHVLRPGDFLWIPDSLLPNPQVTANTIPLYQQSMGGTDWATTPNKGMMWATNDLATVTGPQSLLQNAAHRIQTPLGALWWSPQTGSLVQNAIGTSSASQATKLAALSLSAVKQDARLNTVAVKVQTLPQDPTYWQITIASELSPAAYTTVVH